MQQWSQDADNGYPSFTGPGGQTFVNELVKQAEARPSGLATLLPAVLRAPEDETEAAAKLAELVAWVESVKKGPHRAPGHVPFLCSLFWSMQEPGRWPCLWRSAEQMLIGQGWLVPTQDQVKRYVDFCREMLALDAPPVDLEYTRARREAYRPPLGRRLRGVWARESVMMKLLAITHTDRYIPVFPFTGDMGKARLMRLVDLDPPPATASRGERQVGGQ